MKQVRTTIGIAIAIALVIGITTSTTAALAQVDNPSFAGQTTAQATEDYRNAGDPSEFGAHASNPTDTTPQGDQTGRNGLSQALTDRGNPLHPSTVFETICTIDPSAAGC